MIDAGNGVVIDRTVEGVRRGLATIATADTGRRAEMSRRARATAEGHSWDRIAGQYLALLRSLRAERQESR